MAAPDYLSFLDQMARKYGVSPAEARAIYERETASGRNVRTSQAGAIGQMQLMPGTARELGVNPNDPYQNIEGGVRYYAQQRKRFGDPALAAAAYNAGPGRVARAGGVPNIGETRNYVSNFLRDIGRVRPSQPAAASATVPPTTQGTTPMPAQPPLGGLAAGAPADSTPQPSVDYNAMLQKTYEDLVGLTERQQAAAQEGSPDWQAAEQRIKQQFAGPSTSDRLWALSRALLSPMPYRGFAGAAYNVSQAMGSLHDRASEAERSRAQALAQLRESYAKRGSEAEIAALQARGKLAEAGLESEERRAKALEPKFDVNPAGGYMLRPGTGGGPQMPQTDERGNYVITDMRQIKYLPPGSGIVRAGGDPNDVKYVPVR